MFSFACPTYNEGKRLKRFLRSCCKIKNLHDIYIIDHRSTDSTQDILKQFAPICKNNGIILRWHYEDRDWQKNFMMGDIRELSVKKCLTDIAFVQDADFVFGPNYQKMIDNIIHIFNSRKDIYAIGYPIPVIRGDCKFDTNGIIQKCSDCIMHMPIHRVVRRNKVKGKQTHVRGRHYWLHSTDPKCKKSNNIDTLKSSIVSVNIKPPKRLKFRKTMTDFFEAVINYPDKTVGWKYQDWLDAIDEGKLNWFYKDKKDNGSLYGQYNIIGERFFI